MPPKVRLKLRLGECKTELKHWNLLSQQYDEEDGKWIHIQRDKLTRLKSPCLPCSMLVNISTGVYNFRVFGRVVKEGSVMNLKQLKQVLRSCFDGMVICERFGDISCSEKTDNVDCLIQFKTEDAVYLSEGKGICEKCKSKTGQQEKDNASDAQSPAVLDESIPDEFHRSPPGTRSSSSAAAAVNSVSSRSVSVRLKRLKPVDSAEHLDESVRSTSATSEMDEEYKEILQLVKEVNDGLAKADSDAGDGDVEAIDNADEMVLSGDAVMESADDSNGRELIEDTMKDESAEKLENTEMNDNQNLGSEDPNLYPIQSMTFDGQAECDNDKEAIKFQGDQNLFVYQSNDEGQDDSEDSEHLVVDMKDSEYQDTPELMKIKLTEGPLQTINSNALGHGLDQKFEQKKDDLDDLNMANIFAKRSQFKSHTDGIVKFQETINKALENDNFTRTDSHPVARLSEFERIKKSIEQQTLFENPLALGQKTGLGIHAERSPEDIKDSLILPQDGTNGFQDQVFNHAILPSAGAENELMNNVVVKDESPPSSNKSSDMFLMQNTDAQNVIVKNSQHAEETYTAEDEKHLVGLQPDCEDMKIIPARAAQMEPSPGKKKRGRPRKIIPEETLRNRKRLSESTKKKISENNKKFSICKLCNRQCRGFRGLVDHMYSEHPDHKPWACHYCSVKTPFVKTLYRHLKTEHQVSESQCPKCNKRYTRAQSMLAHVNKHDAPPERVYTCPTCRQIFSTKEKLELHTEKKHTFECDYCYKRFEDLVSLKEHRRKHTRERPFQCTECGSTFTFQSTFTNHMKMHFREKGMTEDEAKVRLYYDCDQCDKSYVNSAGLRMHKRHVHENFSENVPCHVCGKAFRTRELLKQHHERYHTDSPKFACDVCGQRFGRRYHLKRHRKLHTADGFPCDQCSRVFKREDGLKLHMKSHERSSAMMNTDKSPDDNQAQNEENSGRNSDDKHMEVDPKEDVRQVADLDPPLQPGGQLPREQKAPPTPFKVHHPVPLYPRPVRNLPGIKTENSADQRVDRLSYPMFQEMFPVYKSPHGFSQDPQAQYAPSKSPNDGMLGHPGPSSGVLGQPRLLRSLSGGALGQPGTARSLGSGGPGQPGPSRSPSCGGPGQPGPSRSPSCGGLGQPGPSRSPSCGELGQPGPSRSPSCGGLGQPGPSRSPVGGVLRLKSKSPSDPVAEPSKVYRRTIPATASRPDRYSPGTQDASNPASAGEGFSARQDPASLREPPRDNDQVLRGEEGPGANSPHPVDLDPRRSVHQELGLQQPQYQPGSNLEQASDLSSLSNAEVNRVLCLPPQDQIPDNIPILQPHMSTPISRGQLGNEHIELTISNRGEQQPPRRSVIMMNRKI